MVVLNMWILPASTPHPKQLLAQEIAHFQEKFGGIEVNLELLSWAEGYKRIPDLANQKEGPDIIQLGSTWNGELASLGLLKDITELVETIGGEEIFVPAAWQSCCFPKRKKKLGSILEEPERVSSLPWFVDIRTLYYREDIFKEVGLKAIDLETWDTFLEVCRRLQGLEFKGKKIDALGVSAYKHNFLVHNIAPWIWGAGGDFISPEGDKAIFNSDASLKGVEFFLGLAKKGYISNQSLIQETKDVAYNFSVKGDYVMSFSGAHYMLTLDRDSVLFIPEISRHCIDSLFPSGPSGRFVYCGGSNLAITNFSPNPEDAWNLIKFLVSFDSQNRYPNNINMLPSLLESFDVNFILNENKVSVLKESCRFGRAFPNVPAWQKIEEVLVDYLAQIWDRVKQKQYDFSLVKKDLDEAAQKADELLAK